MENGNIDGMALRGVSRLVTVEIFNTPDFIEEVFFKDIPCGLESCHVIVRETTKTLRTDNNIRLYLVIQTS